MIGFALLLQISVPPPQGYVNDFAGVLDTASIRHMEAVITEVRAKTRGEIAVVTLADIGDRAASDVAVQIVSVRGWRNSPERTPRAPAGGITTYTWDAEKSVRSVRRLAPS